MPDIINDNSNKKKALGRGIGSLLGGNSSSGLMGNSIEKPVQRPAQPTPAAGASVAAAPAPVAAPAPQPQIPAEARIWKVGIDKLKPSPFQPRTQFEKEKLEELSESIKTSGIIQPIVVRKTGTAGFEIIAGERRWRAAQLAGLHEVPVIMKDMGDRETLEMAIIENIQREDLNPMEEAEAYQRLAHEFELTQQQVAEKVGRERASVTNAIRLLQLPRDVRELIATKELSVGHAKVLLSLPESEEQSKWAQSVLKEGLTVRKLEKMLKKDQTEEPKSATDTAKESVTGRLIQGLSEELQKLLGTKVTIDYHEGKGRVAIQYYTDEQLTSVVDRIRVGCQKS
ncbi:MAG: ParB/RepB/Spo0J family partition protein [Bdellovibrionaceae bacterium]|nr:ParB/RepB/Spo0J family partition protein [Pseudobdellovibrionaceae bacterium]